MFPNLSGISSSYGPSAVLPVSYSDVTNKWPEISQNLVKLYLHTDVVRQNCKLSPLFTLHFCVITLCLILPGLSRLQIQKWSTLFLTHLQQHYNRHWCVRCFCHLPSPLCDLNQILCHTWGTGTIKSTNQQMPGCSAQSAPVWQSVLLVITASWLGSLNIHPLSAGNCSKSVAPVAGLFT